MSNPTKNNRILPPTRFYHEKSHFKTIESHISTHQLTIAHERLYLELEFALEPDLEVIERSLQILKEQHEADQAIVRRVIDLMAEEGAA